MNIYVLPSEENLPPRAMIFEGEPEVLADLREEGGKVSAVLGAMATWSRDAGTWTVNGTPLPAALAELITEHAKSLGVEW